VIVILPFYIKLDEGKPDYPLYIRFILWYLSSDLWFCLYLCCWTRKNAYPSHNLASALLRIPFCNFIYCQIHELDGIGLINFFICIKVLVDVPRPELSAEIELFVCIVGSKISCTGYSYRHVAVIICWKALAFDWALVPVLTGNYCIFS